MPKNHALKKVMIIGSGPIVIGQAAEFDFSGSQACKSVREEGLKVVLVNSNPATIQTDPTTADAVYVEPLTVEFVEKIIAKERPDGILSGMGGQTALNLCSELAEKGILAKYGVALLGSSAHTIEVAEDRDKFRELMHKIGEPVPRSHAVSSVGEAKKIASELGYPVIVRAAFTLGGTGSGIAHNEEDIEEIVGKGLIYSRIGQVLIEECVLGWGEFEYEVMRDSKDNCIIICSMENIDPMGIHTGESIVVAPAQTLSDNDHQMLRNAALKIIRALEIEGGCNIQFALNYDTGKYYIIEVNPRVSRSSALASKATGYPIARTAAKIAIGMTLDEIKNPITGNTYAAFEPALDYVTTKIPRWPFDKFRTIDRHIGTSMKSTGEVMAIGRSIEESLQKAVRSLEIKRFGLCGAEKMTDLKIEDELRRPTDERLFAVAEALRRGKSIEWVEERTKYSRFFIRKIKNIMDCERELRRTLSSCCWNQDSGLGIPHSAIYNLHSAILARAKQYGFSNRRISELSGRPENEIADMLGSIGILPKYNIVDTCAAEFEAVTPYYYSTYASCLVQTDNKRWNLNETDNKGKRERGERHPSSPSSLLSVNVKHTELLSEHTKNIECLSENTKNAGTQKQKVLIIGAGPIRIGQGIEFDYCCVHAALALKEKGFDAIMINNNPETVSTDFDTSTRLYFEPLTLEDVMNVIEHELPDGAIVQFGGQTSVNLAIPLKEELRRRGLETKIWGTSPEAIDLAEDRELFEELMRELGIKRPQAGTGMSFAQVESIAEKIGYPVLIRPSYVLGGRAMEIVHSSAELEEYMKSAVEVSEGRPVLVDKFLTDAIEIDVDALCDGKDVLIGGIMEHIEEAGVHSGDATMVIPSQTLSPRILFQLKEQTRKIALALKTIGVINIQFAVQNGIIYIIEANPRASRTIPFVSKAIGVPMARIAVEIMIGESLRGLLAQYGASDAEDGSRVLEIEPRKISVKASVFPFQKLRGVDSILGPEMKSTGEVMGIDEDFGAAYYKAMAASGNPLPLEGTVYLSVRDEDKPKILDIARSLREMRFKIVASAGTAALLSSNGVPVGVVHKISEHKSPDAIDMMRKGEIKLVINTPKDEPEYQMASRRDGYQMRRLAVDMGIPFITTVSAAKAAVGAIAAAKSRKMDVEPIK